MSWRPLVVAALVLACGCQARPAPYRFQAPGLVGVTVADFGPLAERAAPRAATSSGQGASGPAVHRRSDARRDLGQAILVEPGDSLVSHLRSLVGSRDGERSSTEMAVMALRSVGATVDADLAGTREGLDLVSLAEARGAWTPPSAHAPVLGDLLVFDRVEADRQASLVAIVVRTDSRGVTEFLYLQDGRVRRGFVYPAQPGRKRDEDGKVLNTHVRRGLDGGGKDTRYLAGELLAGVIRRDALVAR